MTYEPRDAKINLATFRVVQIISFVLGLAPCKIDIAISSSKDIKYITKFSYSKSGCAYNILLIIIFSVLTIACLPYISKEYDLHYSEFIVVIDLTMSVIGNVFVVITALIYCIHQKRIVKIGNQLSEIQSNLSPCVAKKSRIFYYVTIISSFVLIWVSISVGQLVRSKIFLFISFVLSAILLSGFIMQYSLIVNVLRDNFEDLNRSFYTIVKVPEEFRYISGFPRNIAKTRLIIQNFIRIRETRHALYKVSCQISHFYSFPVLLTIVNCCGNCISILYFSIINFKHRESTFLNSISPTVCILDGLSLLALYGYPVVVLTNTVKRFNAEINKTTDILYDVRQANASNEELVAQLHDFALELVHKKVEFTAFGFFSLDCTLLHSIFGMIVTYLMILLQFKPPDTATE
ncbi:putative gustatory receptor 28a [Diachasma alloeum]|uniref:Gustatory receptor n=1 Tax=Diachasma alloeum TaxID=454923 RepID=A0A4E0RM98_9HYME|nr:putative gustatory receptor 28a [Diachasma alloeum]THK32868.1 gustatory receptor 31 [Diachasma alloeum]